MSKIPASKDDKSIIVDYSDSDPEQLRKIAIQRFNRLTYAIVGEISSMLKKAKIMPMEDLRSHDPTFEEIVKQLRVYRLVASAAADALGISEEDEMADPDIYIELADGLAKAIKSNDHDALCEAIAALDEKPYI